MSELIPSLDTTAHLADLHLVSAPRQRSLTQYSQGVLPSLHERARIAPTATERRAVTLIERSRPIALRTYDQIPMRADDLLYQAKFIAPYVANKSVAFVGDYDSASALLGLLSTLGDAGPAHMLVLDFDERILAALQGVAHRHGFADRLEARLFNVFDPVPPDLAGRYDWFYTNPPYGSRNNGASGRLFIARGCEITHGDASGCIILPDDPARPWSRQAMLATQRFLITHDWVVREKFDAMHRYHLDDDRDLSSSLLLIDHVAAAARDGSDIPYAGRRVAATEVPYFYGRAVAPPYPRYIDREGNGVFVDDCKEAV